MGDPRGGRARLGVRSDLEAVEPYVSPQLPARVRLNTNESPFPPPAAVTEAIRAALAEASLNRYPSRDADGLLDALSAHTGIAKDRIAVANGSNEVLLQLGLAFGGPGRRVLVFEPTYQLHSLIARITGTEVVTSERDPSLIVTPEIAAAAAELHRPHIAMLCSPNNPSGGSDPVATISALLERVPMVVVDEAYVEFAAEPEGAKALLRDHENLVITRTFSKAWRLAGIRLGYLLAAAAIVKDIARVRLPYHLSTPAQAAGEAALANVADARSALQAITAERDRIATALSELGLEVYPSDANFVLFRVAEAPRVWRSLLDRGVLVRDYSKDRRLTGCLRVTAGLAEETDAFLDALREVIA